MTRERRTAGAAEAAANPPLMCSLAKLFKVRVVGLLVFAAATGALVGSDGRPGLAALLLVTVAGGLAATGASALNEYLESEPDARMERTRQRPLVTGAIARRRSLLLLGMAMIGAPALAVLPTNPAFALFLTLGALIYIGVYTMWLKPRTALNVVIGGLAGSCAVLTGGAAVGAWSDPRVLTLALLLFFWSPTHFWSLALACREDYARAGVPMLPVVASPRLAASWGLVHAFASVVTGLSLGWRPGFGLLYLLPAGVASLFLLVEAARLLWEPSSRRAWRLFFTSNFYLGSVLLSACLASVV